MTQAAEPNPDAPPDGDAPIESAVSQRTRYRWPRRLFWAGAILLTLCGGIYLATVGANLDRVGDLPVETSGIVSPSEFPPGAAPIDPGDTVFFVPVDPLNIALANLEVLDSGLDRDVDRSSRNDLLDAAIRNVAKATGLISDPDQTERLNDASVSLVAVDVELAQEVPPAPEEIRPHLNNASFQIETVRKIILNSAAETTGPDAGSGDDMTVATVTLGGAVVGLVGSMAGLVSAFVTWLRDRRARGKGALFQSGRPRLGR